MGNISSEKRAKLVFERDCKKDGNPILTEEVKFEVFNEPISSLSIVQQYQKENRDKKPVFH